MIPHRHCRAYRHVFWVTITVLVALGTGSLATAAQSTSRPDSGMVDRTHRSSGDAHPPPAAYSTPKDESLRATLNAADSLYREGALQKSLDRLRTARQADPENADVLYRLAFAWADLGKRTREVPREKRYYQRAMTRAKKALAVDSTNAWAHLALAVTQGRFLKHIERPREKVRRSRAVKRHAEQALALDSTLADAYYVRGLWEREVANIGFFRRAVVKVVYGGLPDASIEQALEDFRRALQLKTRTYYHLELGRTYLEMGRTASARKHLQATLETPSRSPFAPNHKAEARQLLDKI